MKNFQSPIQKVFRSWRSLRFWPTKLFSLFPLFPLVLFQQPEWRTSVKLEEAWRAWWSGQVSVAEACLSAVPLEAVTAPKDLLSLGWLYWGLGRDQDAQAVFQRIESPSPYRWSAQLGRALALQGQGSSPEVLLQWSVLSREYPWCTVAREFYGRLLEAAGVWGMAREEYRAALAQDGSRVGLIERIARMDVNLLRYEDAYKRYQVLLAMNPEHSAAKQDVAMILTKMPDYPQRQKELAEAYRQRNGPPVITVKKGGRGPAIRVGIGEGLPSVTLLCRGAMIVKEARSGKWVKRVKPSQPVTFRGPMKKSLRISPEDPKHPICVFDVSHGQGQFWIKTQDRCYRGGLELVAEGNGITLVNRVTIEDYLYGVLPAEMGVRSPLEALKAQAIIARSYTLRRRGAHKRFDVCDDVHCAVYYGVASEQAKTNQAVDETRLEVLLAEGKPAAAFFHDSCGGHTRAPAEVWSNSSMQTGGIPEIPGARTASPIGRLAWAVSAPGLPCAPDGETASGAVRWQRWYDREALETTLAPELPVGSELVDVTFSPPTEKGVVEQVTAHTTKGRVEWRGDTAIRRVWGQLRGTVMVAIPRRRAGKLEGLFLFGRGWGHGVGLCQRGAMGLATKGWHAYDLLGHYFPDFSRGRVAP